MRNAADGGDLNYAANGLGRSFSLSLSLSLLVWCDSRFLLGLLSYCVKYYLGFIYARMVCLIVRTPRVLVLFHLSGARGQSSV